MKLDHVKCKCGGEFYINPQSGNYKCSQCLIEISKFMVDEMWYKEKEALFPKMKEGQMSILRIMGDFHEIQSRRRTINESVSLNVNRKLQCLINEM